MFTTSFLYIIYTLFQLRVKQMSFRVGACRSSNHATFLRFGLFLGEKAINVVITIEHIYVCPTLLPLSDPSFIRR